MPNIQQPQPHHSLLPGNWGCCHVNFIQFLFSPTSVTDQPQNKPTLWGHVLWPPWV